MVKTFPPFAESSILKEPLIQVLQAHLTIRAAEKEKHGEVFTPLELVYDQLDKLPAAVWQNPTLKWLDPANGIGNYPIVVYYRLMAALQTVAGYTNPAVRSKHIIEHMLYMVELNPENVARCRGFFQQLDSQATPNLVCADFLQGPAAWQQGWQVPMFDIIMGNPPFNSDGIKHKGAKNIYVFFVTQGLAVLRPHGYLTYIHPPTYRIPNHKIQHTRLDLNAIYTQKKILCIRMFTVEQTKQMMHVMINVDYILVQNTAHDAAPATATTIIDVNNTVYTEILPPHAFIPNFGWPLLKRLAARATQYGALDIVLTSEMHAQITHGTTYKNIHGIRSKGLKICLSEQPHSLQAKRKLIINGIGSYNYVLYDQQGEYGFTQSPVAIIEPSPNTLQLIQSKLFHYLTDATKIIGNNFNIQTATFLPNLPGTVTLASEEALYNYLGFTAAECAALQPYTIPRYALTELLCSKKDLPAD
jgi:hypothetical protein